MGIFDRKPNIEKLRDKEDVKGLIKALQYRKDSIEYEDVEVRVDAACELIDIGGKRAVEPLIEALGDIDWRVRHNAAIALGNIGDERAVEPLIKALDNDVGRLAAQSLGGIGDKRAVKPLIKALGDDESGMRMNAAKALGRIGDKRAIEPLIRTVGDSNRDVRLNATSALRRIGDERVVEALIKALEDSFKLVRVNASSGLGIIGDKRAVEPLKKACKDKDAEVRKVAKEALEEIQKKTVTIKEESMATKRDDKSKPKIKKTGKPNIETLIKKGDFEGLIDALGYKKDSVKDEDAVVREQAAEALGEIGAKRAIKPLIQALHDKAWGVQYCAIEALGNIGDRCAIKPITQRVIETDKERVRGRGMIVLDEVFNLSTTELKKVFLKSKASAEAKQQLM